ncbi:MAG TPA: dihydropteroate synthase [Acidimicrobiia bacterium]|nr:dihydropteroate synthase [Acidimicrobiia bacterium]
MPEGAPRHWQLRRRRLPLTRPLLMGIVNVTPDSFSDGGHFASADRAIAHGRELLAAGADLIDVGGESTRPGSQPVAAAVELERILPVVKTLAAEGAVISVDTAKAEVAERALEAGAELVNDVTAGADPEMLPTVAGAGAGVVLMHMQGTPRTMQDDPRYDDVVGEVRAFLEEQAGSATAAGVAPTSIVIDPGIGFGKTLHHNLELIRSLGDLVSTGWPVMVGASRKGFLGLITGEDDPSRRDTATTAVTALAVARGAAVIRVHDVASSRQAADVAWAVARTRI